MAVDQHKISKRAQALYRALQERPEGSGGARIDHVQRVTAAAGRQVSLSPLRNAYDPQAAGVTVRKVRMLDRVSIAGGIWEGDLGGVGGSRGFEEGWGGVL